MSSTSQPPKRAKAGDEDGFQRAEGRRFAKLADQRWKGPFFFVQMADTQLGMYKRDASWNEELEMIRLAVEHINRLRPAFVIVCGDLTNAYPDKGPSEAEAQVREVADFKAAMAQVDETIPLVCVCGNHDVGNRPTEATIELYRSRFGDDYFQFWAHGMQGIVLNSQVYKDDTHTKSIKADQTEWLRETVHSGPAETKHRVVFSHIPPFITAHDEDSGYFNLDRHTRAELLAITKAAGVRKWFCGHYHRNAGATDPDGLECVITAAVGAQLVPSGHDPLGLDGFIEGLQIGPSVSGMRLVKVQEATILHRWFTMDSVPERCDAGAADW